MCRQRGIDNEYIYAGGKYCTLREEIYYSGGKPYIYA